MKKVSSSSTLYFKCQVCFICNSLCITDVDSADLALLKAASESTEARSSSSVPRVYPRTDDHQAPSTEGLLDFKHATVVKSPGIIDKVLTKSDKGKSYNDRTLPVNMSCICTYSL